MTALDGGVNTDVQTAVENTNADQPTTDGGEKTDVEKKLEELTAKYETLAKESKGKDSKISQLLKEQENQVMANKTTEEQLEYYRNQTALFERKEAFRTSLKGVGLNPDDLMSIIDEKDVKIQAEKFASLIKAQQEQSAKNALEQYKTDTLKKVGAEPKPKETKIVKDKNADKNDFLRGGKAN